MTVMTAHLCILTCMRLETTLAQLLKMKIFSSKKMKIQDLNQNLTNQTINQKIIIIIIIVIKKTFPQGTKKLDTRLLRTTQPFSHWVGPGRMVSTVGKSTIKSDLTAIAESGGTSTQTHLHLYCQKQMKVPGCKKSQKRALYARLF